MADIVVQMNNVITRDGLLGAVASIPMGNNKITGLANGVASTDAVNLSQMTVAIAVVNAAIAPAVAALLPAGTCMPFAQAAAPTGWTQDFTDNANNRMLRVVNVAGGGVGGSSDPILNNVVPAHSHGYSGTSSNVSSDHTHSFNVNSGTESATHTHNDSGHTHAQIGSTAGDGPTNVASVLTSPNDLNVATGIGYAALGTQTANHYHNVAGNTGGISANHTHTYSGTSDNGSSQTNWTPRYINMIICSKN
jgi:hypothetical protein